MTRELMKLLGERLIARKDVKAWQSADGAWAPDNRPMVPSDFEAHLDGSHTMGHYLVRPGDNTCKFFAYDLDVIKPGPQEIAMRFDAQGEPQEFNPREAILDPNSPGYTDCIIGLRCLSEGLAYRINRTLGIPVAIEWSGYKGMHVYGFTGEVEASVAQTLAFSILEGFSVFRQTRGKYFWRHIDPAPESFYGLVTIEVFPKQAEVEEGGHGNLMKLPLGVHQVTKQRSFFTSTNCSTRALLETPATRALGGDLPWE